MAIGAFYGAMALSRMPLGNTEEMGPGYFPLVLSGLLFLIGLVVAGRSVFQVFGETFGHVAWRGIALLTAATVLFATSITGLGLLPGIFAVSVIAGLSSPSIRPMRLVLSGLGIAAFCSVVLVLLIGLPIPLLGSWFGV